MATIVRMTMAEEPRPIGHFCHVVRAGQHVWVSGATGCRQDGSIPADIVEQFSICLRLLDARLRAVGALSRHIVKLNLYFVDVNDRAKVAPLRAQYFGEHRPATTLVGVAALGLPGLGVQIDAEAYVAERA